MKAFSCSRITWSRGRGGVLKGRRTHEDKVGIPSVQGITLVDLGHDGGFAVGGGGGDLIGDVDAEDGDVEVVVHQIHAAVRAGA